MICKNCNTELEAQHKYCHECGAKQIQNRLMPAILVQQVNEQFLSIDNKLLRTFIGLFKAPDIVINSYINGTRKKFIDVLQYFAIALTLAGIQVFLMDSIFKSEMESSFKVLQSIDSSTAENNPFKINANSFTDFNRYQSIIYIITIPFYAVSSWIANLLIKPKFKYNFTEHLVVNIYYYTQVIIITAVLSILFLFLGLDYLLISGIVSVLTLVYHFYTLKKVFHLSLVEAIAFFVMVMLFFFAIGIAGSIVFLFLKYLNVF